MHDFAVVTPVPQPPFEYPDSPFQIGDRVCARKKAEGGHRYSLERYLGVVCNAGSRRRPEWSFNNLCEEIVELTDKVTGIHNIIRSDADFAPPSPQNPDPPSTPHTAQRGSIMEQLLLHVNLCQVFFLDEKHKQCCLGLANPFEYERVMC